MEILYRTTNGRIEANIDGRGIKEVFENLAELCEIFENKCVVKDTKGVIHSSDKIVPRVREVGTDKYYELVCVDDNPVLKNRILQLGQHKQGGTLFPKRSTTVKEGDKEVKKWLPNNGWGRYDAKTGEMNYD